MSVEEKLLRHETSAENCDYSSRCSVIMPPFCLQITLVAWCSRKQVLIQREYRRERGVIGGKEVGEEGGTSCRIATVGQLESQR